MVQTTKKAHDYLFTKKIYWISLFARGTSTTLDGTKPFPKSQR